MALPRLTSTVACARRDLSASAFTRWQAREGQSSGSFQLQRDYARFCEIFKSFASDSGRREKKCGKRERGKAAGLRIIKRLRAFESSSCAGVPCSTIAVALAEAGSVAERANHFFSGLTRKSPTSTCVGEAGLAGASESAIRAAALR